MEKILSQTVLAAIPQKERKRRTRTKLLPNGCLPCRQKGTYAVYVSYQTLPNSVSDAKYLVFHNGGVTEFKVNQKDRRRNLGIPRHLFDLTKATTIMAWWY